jgi:hypothetical protein
MEKNDCFGILDKVFPVSDNGLREITAECIECDDRLSCLKEALATKDGIEMREDILKRAPADGLIGRIRRWSEKKALRSMAKTGKGKNDS